MSILLPIVDTNTRMRIRSVDGETRGHNGIGCELGPFQLSISHPYMNNRSITTVTPRDVIEIPTLLANKGALLQAIRQLLNYRSWYVFGPDFRCRAPKSFCNTRTHNMSKELFFFKS